MSDVSLPDRRRLVLVGVETCLLTAVLAATALAREGGSTPFGALLSKALPTVLVIQLSLYYSELYDDRALRSRVDFFLRLGRSLLAAMLLLALVYYLTPQIRFSPGLLVVFLPLAALGVYGWHGFHRWAGGRAVLSDNVLILGTGHTAQQVAAELNRRGPLGYRVVGFLGEEPGEVGHSADVQVVGTTGDLLRLVRELSVTLVVVALDDRRGRLPVNDLLRCRIAGVMVEDAPSFYERLTGKLLVSDLRPSWLVFSPGFRKSRLLLGTRRVVEFLLAAAALALASPLLVLLVLLIRLDSPGPALLRQERVGAGGRVFELLKLRTMRSDAERSGPAWAAPGRDPRVTRVGRVLRKLRLDELPQLVNVLRGEMSFVGPRPERPHFVEQLRKVIPYYDERHNVPPGITGWAQVKFGYGSTIEDSERKLQFDLYYIKNMSLFLDLAIVLDTLKVVAVGRGAR